MHELPNETTQFAIGRHEHFRQNLQKNEMRTAACHVLHKRLLKFMGKRITFLVDIRWLMYVNGHGQS